MEERIEGEVMEERNRKPELGFHIQKRMFEGKIAQYVSSTQTQDHTQKDQDQRLLQEQAGSRLLFRHHKLSDSVPFVQ
jgi:hypothetical protein